MYIDVSNDKIYQNFLVKNFGSCVEKKKVIIDENTYFRRWRIWRRLPW